MQLLKLGLLAILPLTSAISILDHGAIPSSSDLTSALANSQAIVDAFTAANSSATDRVVEVPAGAAFFLMTSTISDVHDVTFQIDGALYLHNTLEDWPDEANLYGFHIVDVTGFTLTGSGSMDGQGYNWWVATAKGRSHAHRPNLFEYLRAEDCLIENITVRNSPRFNFHMKDMLNLEIRYVDIETDVTAQRAILEDHKLWDLDLSIPMFPFNTDGFDPAGENIWIHDCSIENYDDAVAVKPSGSKDLRQCTKNVLVENMKIKYGVGMSVGSVSPKHSECVDDVTFRNIDFKDPFKAIYIKTNPLDDDCETDDCVATISNVLYEDITIDSPVWFAVYIGPQQMKEPDGAGDGCMTYPFGDCPTEPAVTISNITLKHIAISGGVTPGIVRCDKANPCHGFEFKDVKYSSWATRAEGWTCEHVHGTEKGTQPEGCIKVE